MRRLSLALFGLLTFACQPDRSPGGGTAGTATPNGFMKPGSTMQTGGNGIGVSEDTYLDEMTPAEHMALCDWVAMKQGGGGRTECADGTTVNVDSPEECLEEDDLPHCKVGLVVECMESIANDPCRLLMTAECGVYVQCALGGDSNNPDPGGD